jgi:hypothetical protein
MKSSRFKVANSAQTGKVCAVVPVTVAEPPVSDPSSAKVTTAPKKILGSQGKHVYRVGGFRIPTKNSVRGPKSRCAGRVKDLLRRRAESPVTHFDPTAFEPPIRKPSTRRDRHDSHDFSASRDFQSGRERLETDEDLEDLDDDE